VSYYLRYNKYGVGQGAHPQPLLAVPNVTFHPIIMLALFSTSKYLILAEHSLPMNVRRMVTFIRLLIRKVNTKTSTM